MVGIVIVSHSRALAEALRNLVRQVSSPDVSLAISAGIGDDRSEFGTDAVELMEAIQSVHSPQGVLVLMDLGSAVLSAEMALELLPAEISVNVRLCPAPLVEGAIAAAVQAGLGSDLETVYQEARSALGPKLEHLAVPGGLQAVAPPGSAAALETPDKEITLTILNRYGLHARPAARFVKAAASFDAQIQVINLTNQKGPVSARSLNAVATLGAVKGHQIRIIAQGRQAGQAIEKLAQMVTSGFDELVEKPEETTSRITEDGLPAPKPPDVMPGLMKVDAGFQATPVSDGIAIGPFFRYQAQVPSIPEHPAGEPVAEWQSLQDALERASTAIRLRQAQLASTLGENQAAIFEVHELILQDPDLLAAARAGIFDNHYSAAHAWHQAINQAVESYLALDNAYLRQRASDVRDVGNQVLFALGGDRQEVHVDLEQPVILFAEELTPTETAGLDMSKILGLMTVGGGPTSHSAILARALGIPAVSGVSRSLETLPGSAMVGLDGFRGTIWVDPSEQVRLALDEQRHRWLEERQRLLRTSQALAVTSDGRRVEVSANVGSVLDASSAAENGAEGIGLLRTEFLFLTRKTPPGEQEQYDMLCQVGQALHIQGGLPRPMIVRTLDVGGDKELPYIKLSPEANPFLGVRALRLSLRQPELFFPQLKAILRAGQNYPFRIMFPMVANLDEVLRARENLERCHQELVGQGILHRWPVETGIMIEIPSAALMSSLLAQHVDFFSIGTNDLTQYTLAAERGNPALAGYSDGLHPAVLSLVSQVVQASHKYGKWTGVCGELAGDPLATAVLVGLGVDELSMSPGSIPRIKAVIHAINTQQAVDLAQNVLQAESAESARQLAHSFYEQVILPGL